MPFVMLGSRLQVLPSWHLDLFLKLITLVFQAMVVMMTTMDTVMAMVLAPTSGLDEVLKACRTFFTIHAFGYH